MTPSQRHSDEPREATIADEVTPELVLAHLAKLSQPASIRHIAHGMGLKHRGRRYLPRVLQKLKKHGEVDETQGGKFRLAGTSTRRRKPLDRRRRQNACALPIPPRPQRLRRPNRKRRMRTLLRACRTRL